MIARCQADINHVCHMHMTYHYFINDIPAAENADDDLDCIAPCSSWMVILGVNRRLGCTKNQEDNFGMLYLVL